MRFLFLMVVGVLAACSSSAAVPCTSDAQCEKFGAVCSQGYCALPRDLSVGDLAAPDALASVDLDVPDLEPDTAEPSACPGPCPDGAPICGTDGQCHPCGATDDSACVARSRSTPRCDTSSGTCAACRLGESADCSDPAFPACSFDGSCRASCTVSSDCASGVCDPGIVTQNVSSCAWSDEIVYAEGGVSCAAGTGSQSAPYCSLVTALQQLPSGGFIRALGSATSLPRLSTTVTAPYVIVGDGPTVSTLVDSVVPPAGYPALVTVGTNGRLSLQDIGLVGVGAMVCSGPATLKLYDVSITDAIFSTGLASTGCDLTIDRFRVEKCATGISVSGGTLEQLTNAIVASNAGTGVHIATGTTVSKSLGYLTVADNTPSATTVVGGIQCDVAVNITDSIIWGNQAVSGESYAGTCAFTYTDINPAVTGTGNLNIAPTFTSDYHLSTSPSMVNDLCCKEKAVAFPGVSWDIDNDDRFFLYIGADEIKMAL